MAATTDSISAAVGSSAGGPERPHERGAMARRYFGTDGIRGLANSLPMTSETALKVGMAAGKLFSNGQRRHRVVIGKDTRLSGYMIESALMSGFTAVGMDVFLLGPMPTPAVAMLTRSLPIIPPRTTASSSLTPTATSSRTRPRARSKP
jgi:phosphomannomutase